MAIITEISKELIHGNRKQVVSLCRLALNEGIKADDILKNGLLAGMESVAEQYKANQIFVPHVIMVTSAMTAGTEILEPYLTSSQAAKVGKACFGTMRGDIHDIGKCLCMVMAKSRGIEVIDLGVDVPAEDFVETAVKENCSIIGCSALLTTTMTEMSKVIREAENAGIRDKVSIFIGGAPVSQKFCDRIGADYFTKDAVECSTKMLEVLRK